jgi:ubiquinone/menaquinone biosynthesis C-methylase UbiE
LTSSQSIQETYDRVSSLYDIVFKPFLESGRKRAIEVLAPSRNAHILDIGIGTGLGLDFFPADVQVTGFDFSHGMLRESKKKSQKACPCNLSLLQMDVQQMALPDNSFDYIMASYVLTVVNKPKQAIKEILRVAKPNAKVVIVNRLRSQNSFFRFFEDLLEPVFSRMGLFSINRDLVGLLKSVGVKEMKLEAFSTFKTHYLISFNVPEK